MGYVAQVARCKAAQQEIDRDPRVEHSLGSMEAGRDGEGRRAQFGLVYILIQGGGASYLRTSLHIYLQLENV